MAQDVADLLRDTLEELSLCDEDDLARCGLPPGWYGTRVRSSLDQNGDSPTAVLVIRLGSRAAERSVKRVLLACWIWLGASGRSRTACAGFVMSRSSIRA